MIGAVDRVANQWGEMRGADEAEQTAATGHYVKCQTGMLLPDRDATRRQRFGKVTGKEDERKRQ